MRKKLLTVAALWLALAALVFLYTDRDAFTWRFEGDTLGEMVVTEEEAQQAQAQADAQIAQKQSEARARAEAGEWGEEDMYDGAPKTRPAQDDEPGLNLMWGEYDVEIAYDAAQPVQVRIVSAGRQPFIVDGEASLAPGQGQKVSFRFTLTDSAEHVRLACTLPEGASLAGVTVRRVGAGVFSPDLAAYAALLGVVLTVLIVLGWDTRSEGRARRRDALVLVFAAVFASMPLLWDGVYGGHDLLFHLNRIEGIASGLRAGQFPVRIHASTLLGYGYAAPQFYPELFLYFPAVLRNLGVSLSASVRVFEMTINLMCALVCYVSAKRLFASRRVALGASVLYTLCVYRLVNLYTRATIGESLAMIFFPLLIWAMVEVLTRDERRWPLLALAMTGICMSHLLSTLFAVLFCTLAALCCAPRLVRKPRRILAVLKAAAITVLCSLWFFVPMLDYVREGISTSVVLHASDYVHRLGSYLVSFSGNMAGVPEEAEDFAYTIGVVPGLAMLMGCALLLVRRYAAGRTPAQDGRAASDKLALALLALGVLGLLGATEFFPWPFVCSLRRPFSTFFMQMQFPWRLVGVAAPMLAMAGAWGYLREERHAAVGMAAIVMLSVVFSGYTLQCFVQTQPVLTQESFCDTRIDQYEYTYVGTEKGALKVGDARAAEDKPCTILSYSKQGTNLSVTLSVPEGGAYIELPLLYYPGYKAEVEGVEVEVSRGENNLIRIYGMQETHTPHIRIWFEAPALWLVAQGLSVLGAALLALSLGYRRIRRRA